jgi:Uma2 family endonuclease
MTDQTRIRMTAAEFFQLPETTRITELIDGELIVGPTPVPEHQRLVFRSASVVDDLKPDGEVFIAPISVYLDENNIPEPDILWIAANSQCSIGEKYLEGAPDLIIEVLSPSTARYDKTVKFLLYEKYGVREYWMIDPSRKVVDVWTLVSGQYSQQGVFDKHQSFISAVLAGKTIHVSAIFE